MTEAPDTERIETSFLTYEYVMTPADKDVSSCSVCGGNVPHPYRQIQYHQSKETGNWIMDFAIFGHRNCLIGRRRHK